MPKFGVARKYAKDLPNYIVSLSQKKIDAYEMGFAFGIPQDISDDVITLSKKQKVTLSCHLPFWINLGNSDRKKNIDYLTSGLRLAEKLRTVAVFHLGFYGGKKFNSLKEDITNVIKDVLDINKVQNAKLGIEITGRQKAIGTCDEIIELINFIYDERVIPVIDWSHLYARNNGTYPYTYEDFKEVLKKFENEIGYKPFYFHGSGIEYKNGNEIRHLSVKKCEPPLPRLFAALQDLGYNEFTLILESPDPIGDVIELKQVWESPRDHFDRIPNKIPKTLFDFGSF